MKLLQRSLLLLAMVLLWLLPTVGIADSNAPLERRPVGHGLLQPAAIYAPNQEFWLENESWIVSSEYLTAAQQVFAEPAKNLNEEVAFGTSVRSETLSQLQQAVTMLPGGGYAVVWAEGDFPERDVRMQWLGPNGEKLLEPQGRIVAGRAGFEEANAVVAPHSEVGVFVAFKRGAAPSNFASIYVQSFDASGLPRWPGDGVRVANGGGQSNPHLVPDLDGGVYVCWKEGSGGLKTVAIWCQHLNSSGEQMWGAEGLMAGGQPGLRVLPRGVSDGSGGLLIFWRNQRDVEDSSADPMLMEGQHFTTDGIKLWGEEGLLVRTTNLMESNAYGNTFYNVVSDGSGGAILSFNDWVESSASNLDVVAQRVAADGSLLWGDGAVVAATAGHHQHETTVAAPDGGAFVVAYEGISSTRSKLWLYRLGGDGAHHWPAAGLELSNPAATALDYGAFGSFDEGLLRLVWTHQRFPATFEMDVQFARYTSSGVRLDGPAGLAVTMVPDGQFVRGFTYSAEARNLLAVWDDRRKGTSDDLDTYGSLFLPGGIFLDGFESGDTSAWTSTQE